MRDELSLAVVTNDIFTTEDAQALRRAGVLAEERIVAVETGCCPHTAIRDDIAANLDAIEELEMRLDASGSPVDVTLVESGGDNLTAVFSTGLVDAQIFVLDTAGGDDVPRKGGPGVAMADVLVINKVDLAGYVGADVERMLADAADRRAGRPVVPTSLVDASGAAPIAEWILRRAVGVASIGAGGVRRDVNHARPIAGRPTMRASARIEVAHRDGRDVLVDARSEPPLAIRNTADRILLVGSAAAPVGGDALDIDVVVGPNASASIGSVAATSIFPGPHGERSHIRTTVAVAGGGRLLWWPEPLVSIVDSDHRSTTRVDLARGRPLHPDRGDLARPIRPGVGNARDWICASSATACRSCTTSSDSGRPNRGRERRSVWRTPGT